MKELTGKVALVTGGARGLGEQISRELAHGGATVVIGDVRTEMAESVAKQIRDQGGQCTAVPLDVTNPIQAEKCCQKILADFDRLDVLVNNAGVDKTCSIEELSFDDWGRILAVNLTGPFIMSKQALAVMASRKSATPSLHHRRPKFALPDRNASCAVSGYALRARLSVATASS